MEQAQQILETFHGLADRLETYFHKELQPLATAFFKTGANGESEIVTKVDKEIEDLCIHFLSSSYPDVTILAEEHYEQGMTLPEKGWFFVVDPIDGTEEFFRGSNEWSISLAAVFDQVPLVGMLVMPQEHWRFAARKGAGVQFNCPINLNINEHPNEKKIAVSPRQNQIPEILTRINRIGFKPMPVPTLTIKIVSILREQVAAGVYFPQKGKSATIWDYAAALLLIEESGGRMTSLDGSSLPFSGCDVNHWDGWLATNSRCDHYELLRYLQIDKGETHP